MSQLRADDQTAAPVAAPWTAKLAAACGVLCAVALVGAGAVIVILAVGPDEMVRQAEEWIGISVMAAIYSAMLFAAALLIHRRVTRPLQLLMFLLAPAAFVLLLLLLPMWYDSWSWRTQDMLGGIVICLTVVQVAILLTGALALLRIDSPLLLLSRIATWAFLWLATSGAVVLIYHGLIVPVNTMRQIDQVIAMSLGFTIPLTFISLAVTFVGYRIHANRRKNSETLLRNFVVSLVCPRCETDVSLKPGESLCPGCRILMRLEVDEPKCACGYQLYRLEGDNCPECGHEIREDQRWPKKPGRDGPEASATRASAPRGSADDRGEGGASVVEPVSSDDPDRNRPSPPVRE